MAEGLNENARNKIAEEYVGGAVHLLETTVGDGEGGAALDANSEVEVNTDDSVWSITHDNTAGTTELTNTEFLDFGTAGPFTVNQIVIQSADDADSFLIDPDPGGDVEVTGDDQYIIPSDGVSYTIGGE